MGAGELETEGRGDREGRAKGSLDELFPRVYEQLRDVAAAYLHHERPEHTLAPTALVHEAYIRLAAQDSLDTARQGAVSRTRGRR